MKGSTKYQRSVVTAVQIVVSALVASLLLAGCGDSTGSKAPPGRAFPPDATCSGKTYGEWSAAWWQWIGAIPKANNPLNDPTGEKAGVGQDPASPVWFLAGTFGGALERACTVPAGKAILFPIITDGYILRESEDTEAGARAVVKDWVDQVTELGASVDGQSLPDLWSYRFQPPGLFSIAFDSTDPLVPGYPGTYQAFSDGYWILLEPLSPGPHTIWFRGKVVLRGRSGSPGKELETRAAVDGVLNNDIGDIVGSAVDDGLDNDIGDIVGPAEEVFETEVTYHLTVP